MDTEKEPLLQIEHLQTCFFTKAGVLKAVDDSRRKDRGTGG